MFGHGVYMSTANGNMGVIVIGELDLLTHTVL